MSEAPVNPPPALPGEMAALPESAVPHHVPTFWQQDWVQNVLPFATSLLLHMGIVLLGYFGYKTVEAISAPAIEEQTVIADTGYTEGEVGGIPNPGLGEDPSRPAAQDQVQNVEQSDAWASKPSETLSQSVMSGGAGAEASEMSVIGIGGSTGAGKTAGTGSGEGTGTGEGGGPAAAFGVPGGGGGIGPKFMGQGTGARTRSIVFVCDASGSMINKIALLRKELQKTVDQLKAQQSFNIIFFADEKPQTLGSALLMATPDNKRKAYDFLQNVTTSGSTDPIPGLKAAFQQSPQLVILLTDGDFPDNKAVLDAIKTLNPGKKTKVNTIAFVNKKDEAGQKEIMKLLVDIAKEYGGMYKRVGDDEL
jgi:hypothetical protein